MQVFHGMLFETMLNTCTTFDFSHFPWTSSLSSEKFTFSWQRSLSCIAYTTNTTFPLSPSRHTNYKVRSRQVDKQGTLLLWNSYGSWNKTFLVLLILRRPRGVTYFLMRCAIHQHCCLSLRCVVEKPELKRRCFRHRCCYLFPLKARCLFIEQTIL